jgi:sarcosine oxidase
MRYLGTFDVAVIGLGAAGSAALQALAKSGKRVVGIDQYDPPHALGSSHGETRLLRTAYFEGAFYIPLVKRAITLWKALEKKTGTKLFEQTGVNYAGPARGMFMTGTLGSARKKQVALRPARGMERWFEIGAGWPAVTDVAGGYVYPERAIGAFLAEARRNGATIHKNCRCDAIDTRGEAIILHTARGPIAAKSLVVTTGAWIAELMPELAPLATVERRVLHWFADPKRKFTRKAGFLPFAISNDEGKFLYGFPANAKGEVKVAEHLTVEVIASPKSLNRKITRADKAAIDTLVSQMMPDLGKRLRSTVCMYPMMPDERFLLARHPRDKRIVIGAGLSGHGFKFAPAIGEVLANLALRKKQAVPIGKFGWPLKGEHT